MRDYVEAHLDDDLPDDCRVGRRLQRRTEPHRQRPWGSYQRGTILRVDFRPVLLRAADIGRHLRKDLKLMPQEAAIAPHWASPYYALWLPRLRRDEPSDYFQGVV